MYKKLYNILDTSFKFDILVINNIAIHTKEDLRWIIRNIHRIF